RGELLQIAVCDRERLRRGELLALEVEACAVDEIAGRIDREIAGAGEGEGRAACGAARVDVDDEEAVAGDREIGRRGGRLHHALVVDVVDRRGLDAARRIERGRA